ncbi:hypothetical protein [Lutibacter sp.]|uniref:hypothetical protein n=1 Tax=Lutibacter sp. TaxID=1925666 RepID=UPI0034A04C9A
MAPAPIKAILDTLPRNVAKSTAFEVGVCFTVCNFCNSFLFKKTPEAKPEAILPVVVPKNLSDFV